MDDECVCKCVCSPEQTHDDGAGEQSDERQAVAQRGQDPHDSVENQLDTQNTGKANSL